MDPQLLATFDKLGIPISEQKRLAGVKNVAYDYVFDSESIATTFKKELAQQGIVFCSISEAVREHPDLVRKHLGSVVCGGPTCLLGLGPAMSFLRSFHGLAAWMHACGSSWATATLSMPNVRVCNVVQALCSCPCMRALHAAALQGSTCLEDSMR